MEFTWDEASGVKVKLIARGSRAIEIYVLEALFSL